jgi:GTP pyrophosphokinase
MRASQPRRVLNVDWGKATPERTFPVAIVITAYDRRGLVRDVSAVLADERISIEAMNTATDASENIAHLDLTVGVHGLDELSRLLSRIAGLPNVLTARRRA